MEAYICCGCGRGFDRPADYAEPETGERLLLSPCCGQAFRESARCSGCGRLLPAGEGSLCPVCRREAVDRFKLLLGGFTQEEREAINDAYDGVPLTEEREGRDERI